MSQSYVIVLLSRENMSTDSDSNLACQKQYCELMQCLKLNKDYEQDWTNCQKQANKLQNCCDKLTSTSKICEFLKEHEKCQKETEEIISTIPII